MSTVEKRPIQPEDLLTIKTIADVQLSPDGQRVAFAVTEIDAEADEVRTSIWVVPADAEAGGGPARFTRGPKKDTAPRWSPDGSRLAFLSDRDGEHPQLYVMPAGGGEARKLTSLERGAGPAVWSPDGRWIAFTAPALDGPPPEDKAARARWEKRPRVVTRVHYKDDGRGYTFDTHNRLFVVPADAPDGTAGEEARQLTGGDADDRGPAWSPDGAQIAFSRARSGVADYNLTDLWVMDVPTDAEDTEGNSNRGLASTDSAADARAAHNDGDVGAAGATDNARGTRARRISENIGRATSPSWSPDGTTIACYGTDAQEPGFGESLARVWTVDVRSGATRRLTADYDRGVQLPAPPAMTPPVWSPDGATLTFTIADAGNLHVVRAQVAGGSVRPVVTGERQVLSASAGAAARRIAFCAGTTDDPGDVYVCDWDGSEERRLTRVNQALLDAVTIPRAERRTFASPNGGTIDGWLLRPPTASRPVPLLVQIHGGPHSFTGNVFQHGAYYSYPLAARGWAVLALNPSGSGSYGQAFAHSIRGRWGEHDLPEQLAAVGTLIEEGVADGDRLAVTGYSYGGYMSSWTITQTGRYKAAIIGAPVTNLESFHGTSDIGLWFTPWEMNGDVIGRRDTLRRLSPVNYVERVTTPALILHGEADDRCPIGQGEEFYAGLVAAGRVPTQFVRYPGGNHGFVSTGRPSHRLDYTRRVIDWLERHVR